MEDSLPGEAKRPESTQSLQKLPPPTIPADRESDSSSSDCEEAPVNDEGDQEDDTLGARPLDLANNVLSQLGDLAVTLPNGMKSRIEEVARLAVELKNRVDSVQQSPLYHNTVERLFKSVSPPFKRLALQLRDRLAELKAAAGKSIPAAEPAQGQDPATAVSGGEDGEDVRDGEDDDDDEEDLLRGED